MPKIAEIEDTPNPNARKFILAEPLTWGVTRSYENAEQAQDDALAARCSRSSTSPTCSMSTTGSPSRRTAMPTGKQLVREIAVPMRAAPAASEQSAATVAAATASFARSERRRPGTASTRSTRCSTSRSGPICRATAATCTCSASTATSSPSTTRARAAAARVRFRARCGASRIWCARSSPTSKSSRHRRQHVALYASPPPRRPSLSHAFDRISIALLALPSESSRGVASCLPTSRSPRS